MFATFEGKPRQPDGFTKEFTAAAAVIGLDAGPHTLRHTHAASLIAGGVDILTVSQPLRDANAAITLNVYGHLFINTDAWAAEVADALFSRQGAQ
jgi:integrase